jgi:hypothetical protein
VTTPARLAGPIAALLLVAGCGAAGTGSAPGSPSASGASASGSASGTSSGGVAPGGSASSGGTASWGQQAGCPSVGRAVPAGTTTRPTVDVDGDGRPDTAFIATRPDAQGAVAFGIRTASGAVFQASISSASPIARSVLFADVTGHGEVIALASDGRQVQLWAVSECSIVPVHNAQGQQYAFDLGLRTGNGTGVGCADATGDGVPDLLGLKLDSSSGGTPQQVERTVVVLRGPRATNGARSTVPVTSSAQAQAAQTVTCGDLTLQANGVSSGP